MSQSKPRYKILFQLSGSIACYKSADLISQWVQQGHDIEIIATPSALKFIGEATLEGLTGKPIHTNLWQPGKMMNHISLARWCDFSILCPATAHQINSLAQGSAQDLIGTLFLAFEQDKPYFICPAMNTQMYSHPVVQKSLKTLEDLGCFIFKTGEGRLACGETGEGRLIGTDIIKTTIENHMNRFSGNHTSKNILITSGGTSEAIDSVRAITNTSTGSTGAVLADYFFEKGWNVTLLRAHKSVSPKNTQIQQVFFESFSDLEQQLQKQLGSTVFDTIIHLAAVSDFSVDYVQTEGSPTKPTGKLSSNQAPIVHLKKNKKLVNQIKTLSKNKNTRLVAFKLTDTQNEQDQLDAVQRLLQNSKADIVVHNDFQQISDQSHCFDIYTNTQLSPVEVKSKNDLAIHLEQHLQENRS